MWCPLQLLHPRTPKTFYFILTMLFHLKDYIRSAPQEPTKGHTGFGNCSLYSFCASTRRSSNSSHIYLFIRATSQTSLISTIFWNLLGQTSLSELIGSDSTFCFLSGARQREAIRWKLGKTWRSEMQILLAEQGSSFLWTRAAIRSPDWTSSHQLRA